MNKIEHIGIAVKNLTRSIDLYQRLLNADCYKTETVATEMVKTAFFRTGENKIELLEATSPESPISKFIERKGEGIHHVAFLVDNILEEMERLHKDGFVLLSESPKKGADNKMVCFVHPKDTNGVLIEICQEIKWV